MSVRIPRPLFSKSVAQSFLCERETDKWSQSLKTGELMKLSELKPDPKNANVGTFRGMSAVERSLRDCGAGRSIVTDKNGFILAGNKTAQAAQAAGLDQEVILVQTDGTQLVVVQRTDLDAADKRAKTLAVADNRTAE